MKKEKLRGKELLDKLESDKEYRRKIFKELCNHVSEGLSLECFSLVSDNTIYRYLKDYPDEFRADELELAKKEGRNWWENIGKRQANGSCIGNSRTWYYNMANRYGWREKLDIEAEHKGNVNVNVVTYASRKRSSDDEKA